jgi:hypothetical protein
MTTLSKRLCLTALLALSSFAFAASATAETSKLIIESGDSAQSRQNAAMDKEQWNDTRSLRQKVNKRVEKEWDKEDVAFDARDKCQQSANVNALLGAKYPALPGSSYWPHGSAIMSVQCDVKLRPLEREDLRFVHQLDNNASVMRYWFEEPYEAFVELSDLYDKHIHDQSERRFCRGV